METIGLIAGNRSLPFLFAESAHRAGFRVVAVAFHEETDPDLAKHVDDITWISLGQFKKLIRFFREKGVSRIVMQGQIHHQQIYNLKKLKPDLTALKIFWKMTSRRTESMLGAVADELADSGLILQPATWLMEDWLAPSGLISRKKPDRRMQADLDFGYELARGIGALDIGQTVLVKDLSCVAVESIEGTDAAIFRAAELAGRGLVMVKLARPAQDLRFDLPVVGPKTFQILAAVGAAAVGLEAGKTLFLDREQCLNIVNQHKMVVIAR